MTDAHSSRVRKPVPWRGRRRVPDPKDRFISVRCTAEDHAEIDEQATKAGLSKGAYLRALALGAPGPRAVRRPPIERKELARLLGQLGKVGSNINQLAYLKNATGAFPAQSELMGIRQDIAQMREALIKALGYDH